jgi:ABC-2 type transport system permease protein
VKFTDKDEDLAVAGKAGELVYVNTTAIKAGFNGAVKITAKATVSIDDGENSTSLKFDEAKQDVVSPATGETVHIDTAKIRMTGTHYTEDNDFHVVAAEIKGNSKNGNNINAIYVADTDLISDWFFIVRERKQFRLNLDNVTFVLNAVDHLAGDSSYIDLRKRRLKHRTLVKVEEQTAKFIEREARDRQKAAEEAKKALARARTRLSEKAKKIQNDKEMGDVTKMQKLGIAMRDESIKFEVEEKKINQHKEESIERSKKESERNVRAVERAYYAGALIVAPIPAVILGLLMWILRIAAENKDISASRRRN